MADVRILPGTLPRRLVKSDRLSIGEYGAMEETRHFVESLDEANLVSSVLPYGNTHAPVLDIDFPATLVPSSTPGHSHLYLDLPMSWRKYKRLLRALARAGVIEPGYLSASIERGHTAVRLPWIKKETA